MAVPVELEIFMRDNTKAGTQSVGKNVTDIERQTQLLIKALEEVRAQQQQLLNMSKASGESHTKEAATIQALTGEINKLKEQLKELKEAKRQAAESPNPKVDVDTDAVMRKTNNLKMSFAQVARELPSLAMGPQMFFLAISNNLPMLSDAISDVRKQNELLKASGQKGVPVWKQLASALFSYNTFLVAAISLSIIYGEEIGNWIKNMISGSKATELAADTTERLNKAIDDGLKQTQKDISQLKVLYSAATDTARGTDERKRAVKELKEQYPDYFSKLDNEVIMTGKAADAYERLTANIIASSKARASMKFMDENNAKIIELEREIADAQTKRTEAQAELDKRIEKRDKIDRQANPDLYSAAQMNVGAQLSRVDAIDREIEKKKGQITELNEINEKLTKNINIEDLLGDKTGGKKGTGGTTTKQDFATQLAEARLKAQQTVEKLRIQIMMDGREKRRAIAEQEYKETIADIDRIERETITTLDKSKKQGDIVTDADYKAVRDNATTQRALQQLALNKELEAIDRDYYDKAAEAMIAYNKEYGTYQEKRVAIAAEYAKKILKAETEGERLTLQKQYKKDINALNFEEMKSDIDFAKVFGNIDIQSTGSLKVLQDKLYDYINNAAKDLDPENLKELQDAFKAIDAELLERNPFEGLRQRVEAMQQAAQELEKAKNELERVQNGEQIVDSYRTVTDAQGNTKIEQTYLSAEKALQNYNKAKEKSEETTRNYIKAEQKAKEQVDELASAISGIGDAVGGEAGEILNLIGGITSFVNTSIDGIAKVGQTGAQALSAVEKASVILGIISAALQIMQKINELASDPAYRQYESYAEKINEINQMTDAMNDYRIAVAEARAEESSWFGESGLRDLRDFKNVQKEVLDAYYAKAYESQAIYQNQKHGGWITTPFNAIMAYGSMLAPLEGWRNIWGYGGYDEGTTAAINNLRIETRAKSNGFLGTGIGGKDQKTEDLVTWARNQGLGELFDDKGLINKDLAQSIIDNYGNKLQGQTQETLEQLIELREKYDEYIEQLHEYVASMYEPLVDNFVDGIWDWFDTGKSALDSFKDYASDTFRDIVSDMLRTIVLKQVVGTYADDIAKLYEDYSEKEAPQTALSKLLYRLKNGKNYEEGDFEKQLMEGVADRTEELVDNFKEKLPFLEDMMNSISGILGDAGIDIGLGDTGVNQSPQSGALTTMSQDSIATFEGIGRSVQTHLISIDKVSTEIRDQQREDSKALIKIVENTSHILPIRELLEKIEREGLTVK
ncbi:hypothetical protein [Bacteroides sp.]|uniref:hypothetical protein n=1 Tax=Bacteroides sp. TaxID=29523 RepID=UPI00258A3263|nr:hypothetical protein [Bacteroides sp.]